MRLPPAKVPMLTIEGTELEPQWIEWDIVGPLMQLISVDHDPLIYLIST